MNQIKRDIESRICQVRGKYIDNNDYYDLQEQIVSAIESIAKELRKEFEMEKLIDRHIAIGGTIVDEIEEKTL